MNGTYDGSWLFKDAFELFLDFKLPSIADKTAKCYYDYKRFLIPSFGQMRLDAITIADIREYRKMRQVTAGPSLINHEINVISQILTKADLWEPIAKFYKQMRVPKGEIGQALTREEAMHLFEVANRKPRWKVAYLCSALSQMTAIGPGEILNLRLRDINVESGTVQVLRGLKNKHRFRNQPLNADALVIVKQLLELAHKRGSYLPEHCLIPGRPRKLARNPNEKGSHKKAHFDPTKRTLSYKRAWDSLRTEAAKLYPKLKTFRRYDVRHTAATMLSENRNVSEGTLSDIMGHAPGSHLARDLYSHGRMEPKRLALESLVGILPISPKAAPAIAPQAPSQSEEALTILYGTMLRTGTATPVMPFREDEAMEVLRLANGI